MIYITTRAMPHTRQVAIEDLLFEEVDMSWFTPASVKDPMNTRTVKLETVPDRLRRLFDVSFATSLLRDFNIATAPLRSVSRDTLYTTFFIPKKSGGYRRIDAPKPELKDALYRLKGVFERDFLSLYHTSAFAYCKGRSIVDALKRHQFNESKWFLKTDFSNFFGSTTKSFVMESLSHIWPFSSVIATADGREQMEIALELCFLNGGLPQGTPISPLLTNLMMIPFDHYMANWCRDHNKVYTRYADDILISDKHYFMFNPIVQEINDELHRLNAPFRIKDQKTRYGSSAGANWNLGLMLNQDNQITIGWKRIKRLDHTMESFIRDFKQGVHWDLNQLQTFRGYLSYAIMVEKPVIETMIEKNNRKFGVNLRALLKQEMEGRTAPVALDMDDEPVITDGPAPWEV